jgi:PAS domain S-box-containing protein
MKDKSETKAQFLKEMAEMSLTIAELKKSETRHVEAETALRESEALYRTLIETSPDVIMMYSLGGEILAANAQAAKVYGVSSVDEFLREVKTVFDLLTEEGKTFAAANFRRTFSEGHSQKNEYLVRNRNGALIPVEINSSVVRTAAGEPRAFISVIRDITERKGAEAALRESEEKFRLIAENMADVISVLDMNLRFTYVSPSIMHIRGFTVEEAMEQTLDQVMTPESIETVLGVFAEEMKREASGAADPGRTRVMELEEYKKDGSIVWLENNLSLLRDKDQRPVGILAVTRDITERKRAEEALRESEEKYRSLASAADSMYLVDRDCRFLLVNERHLARIGLPAEQVIGRKHGEFHSAEDAVTFENYVKQVFETGESLQDEHRSVRDGRYFVRTLSPVKDDHGMTLAVTVVAKDITERKRAERTLQRQNVYLESLNETALGLMRRTDLTDLFQAIISRAMRFSGTDEGWICIYDSQNGDFEYRAALGQREYQIGSRVESGRGITGEVWRTEQTVLIDDYHVWPKRANIREYDVRRATVAIPLRYEGRLAGILGLAHHDAARRFEDDEVAMLERLAELASIALDNARLYDRMKLELAERKQAEEENIRLVERLQRAEKMEALGTLAGGVAHDLNNVLGIVVGYAELLLNETDKSSPTRPRLLNIVRGGERAAAIVQDLLTLARRGVPSRQILNLNKVIVDDQHSPEFEMLSSHHPAIRIKTDLEPDLLNISGSLVHLSKTLFNLVSNASEAMPDGGTLTIKTANRHLDKPIQGYDEVREGDYVVLSVSDTGEGIPAADLKRIFEPFYTKKVMGRSGTGLGLSVVWGTVKDHQGYVNVQSEEGKGSTFTLYFPVSREEITAERAAVNISEYMGRGEAILVVDDVQGQRDLAAEMLRNLNYHVAGVSSGEEAVAYLKEHKVDLMVLDMIMDPGMDGLETYRSVLQICPKQKAIIVSGFSETDRVSAAQALGAGAYVRKPYILERLGLAVRKELDRSR